MKRRFDRVYQFRIDLKGIKPPIWRRIQVPETYTFWDLHTAIQDAMGWEDGHLHQFEMVRPSSGRKVEIGPPDRGFGWGLQTLSGRGQKMADYFSMENRLADYTYDFGDDWQHTIKLEKILPRDKDVRYPRCVAGKRACPPEDCGGIWGYEHLLKVLSDPDHEEHQEMMEWVGGGFDPEHFDPGEITFDDPDARYRFAFG